jgi:hypothetical protein
MAGPAGARRLERCCEGGGSEGVDDRSRCAERGVRRRESASREGEGESERQQTGDATLAVDQRPIPSCNDGGRASCADRAARATWPAALSCPGGGKLQEAAGEQRASPYLHFYSLNCLCLSGAQAEYLHPKSAPEGAERLLICDRGRVAAWLPGI